MKHSNVISITRASRDLTAFTVVAANAKSVNRDRKSQLVI